MISDNTQAEPLDKTTVKCRFFCQYFDQIVAKERKKLRKFKSIFRRL